MWQALRAAVVTQVVIVNAGLLLRSFAPPSGKSGSGQQHPSDQHAQHWLGSAAIIASSLCKFQLDIYPTEPTSRLHSSRSMLLVHYSSDCMQVTPCWESSLITC